MNGRLRRSGNIVIPFIGVNKSEHSLNNGDAIVCDNWSIDVVIWLSLTGKLLNYDETSDLSN